MDKATRAWLAKLQSELWERDTRDLLTTARRLTGEEFQRIQRLIGDEPLVTRMGTSNFGFKFCLDLYEHPVTPGVKPMFLLSISEKHLPPPSGLERVLADDGKKWDRSDFAWETFSRYTHSDLNRQWLDFYGWEAPKERRHYEY